jgi:uncharacterized glyoxalase superfamily protein PhnB
MGYPVTVANITHVWPTVRARNPRLLIDFLVAAFGFVEVVAYADEGVIQHAELSWPSGGGIMIGTHREPDDEWAIEPGSTGTYVVTADVDTLFARAVTAGAHVDVSPRDTDYGSRECVVRDIDGNRWSFGSYAGTPVT